MTSSGEWAPIFGRYVESSDFISRGWPDIHAFNIPTETCMHGVGCNHLVCLLMTDVNEFQPCGNYLLSKENG